MSTKEDTMTGIRTRASVGLLAASLVVGAPLLTACGGAAQSIAEKAAGQAIGGDVNVDDNGVTVTDKDGNQMAIGEDVTLPDNWPAGVPVLDGGTLSMVTVGADGSANAMWTTDATAEEASTAYGEALTSGGYTASSSSPSNMGGMYLGEYTGNGFTVSVQSVEADGKTTLLVSATPDS
jgi:hypothetical protein